VENNGKPPFRPLNYVELIRKIHNSKGIKFPDKGLAHHNPQQQQPQSKAPPQPTPVPIDIKALNRALLKGNTADRASLMISSTPQPSLVQNLPVPATLYTTTSVATDIKTTTATDRKTPPVHHIVPPEVFDPSAMICPSKFNFRQRDGCLEVCPPEKDEDPHRRRYATSSQICLGPHTVTSVCPAVYLRTRPV
jgi:serine/threonine-protein kinase ULK2